MNQMTEAIQKSSTEYNWQGSNKGASIGFNTSDNFGVNFSQMYGSGAGLNTHVSLLNNSSKKANIIGAELSNGLQNIGVLEDDSKKAIQTGIEVFKSLGLNGNYAIGNDYSGGAAYVEQNTAGLNANIARVSNGGVTAGLSGNMTYKNFTGSIGLGTNGLPSISAFGKFGADNDTSRSGVNFDIGGRIPAGLVFDIHWSSNGKNFTFPLGSLLTPQGWLHAAGAMVNNVKTLFGERNGAEYEAIAADTRPMKEPYRELTDMDKNTGEVKLNEMGKQVAAQMAKNMLDNPTAKFYIGQQDKDEGRSQKEQSVFMAEIQSQLKKQHEQRQQYFAERGQDYPLDLNRLQQNIEIGQPPKTDKEIISANYANVLIVNNGTFQANSNIFQGLTSVAAKNAEKEILQSAEWQEMAKKHDIKGDEQKQAIRLILTSSNAINENSQITPKQVIEMLESKVYGQGLTMGKIYEEQNLSTHMKRFQDAPEFKAATSNMDLTQADKDVLSMSMLQASITATEKGQSLNMTQLAEIGIAQIAGKTEKDFKEFKKGAEQYFDTLATSPNPIHKMVGNLYSTANEALKLQMTKALLENFQEKTQQDKFPDWKNAGESQFVELSDKKLMDYAQIAHFSPREMTGNKLLAFLAKGQKEIGGTNHDIAAGATHWEAYKELAEMNENGRMAILQKAIEKSDNPNVLKEKYGLTSMVAISDLAGHFAKNREQLAQDTLAYQQQYHDPKTMEMLAKLHPTEHQPQLAQAGQAAPSATAMAQNNQPPAPNAQPEIQQQQTAMEQQQNRQLDVGMS